MHSLPGEDWRVDKGQQAEIKSRQNYDCQPALNGISFPLQVQVHTLGVQDAWLIEGLQVAAVAGWSRNGAETEVGKGMCQGLEGGRIGDSSATDIPLPSRDPPPQTHSELHQQNCRHRSE